MLEPEYADRKRQYEQHEYMQTYPVTKHHHLNDVGNAERLIDKYGNKIRYNYERKLWLIWNGKFWKWDDGSEIMRLAQKTARSIYGEITVEDDEDTAKTKAKWASQSESNQRLCAMIAQTEPLASITLDQLDRDEWLLNANNGTINLKTGKLQPHNPTDLITRVIDTDFVPDATSDQWVKFLNRIFDNKADLVAYIQRAMGYSITGNQGEQAIFFCHGSGWNGKSTLLGVIRKILMAYSSEVEPAAFMVDKNRGGGPNEAIASLYKVNFVSSTEIEDGQKLSTSLLKRMTGGESLRCERKFEHGFNFRPQYKLWLCGNHEPEISDTTNSIWNRLKKIPFIVKISAEERVKDYDTKLVADHGAAILAWLVRGCLEWQRIGLGESSAVKEATQAYRDSQDALHDFLTECCFIKSGETLLITILHKAYIEWSESNGDKYYLGKKKFNDRMEEKGFVKVSGHGNKTVWRGLRLLTEDEKVNLVKMDNQNTQSSYHDDNSLKVSEKQITFLTNLTPTEAKAPKRLETLEENCPFCGSANIGVWPDATPGYYCLDCYPDFYVPAVEIQNDDSHK
jgi:putative DNA primase/helicase